MVNTVIDKKDYFTRGRMAKLLAINPETLRYYEIKKLIKRPIRLHNNYRVYDQEDIKRVSFIIMAKKLGFSLKEIKELLALSLDSRSNREKVRKLVKKKSDLINEKINQLISIKGALDNLIKLCCTTDSSKNCPILDSLSNISINR